MALSGKPLPDLLDDFAIAAINQARDPSDVNAGTLGMVRAEIEGVFGTLFDQVAAGPWPEVSGRTFADDLAAAEL